VNAPLWTLAYEIWFYVLGGALAAIAARKRPMIALAALSVALLVFSKLDARYFLYWLIGGLMVLLSKPPRHACRASCDDRRNGALRDQFRPCYRQSHNSGYRRDPSVDRLRVHASVVGQRAAHSTHLVGNSGLSAISYRFI
jgi:hypothetical protein